ncbi:2-dehydro-3-deoxygalactonokinase (plasmid) [Azospirillum sp. B510]|uniref:2-dehydro-3-deoxygalactonokinase n=1 Tax=Azospirillum sp. (strain B510) TaxID=137722 RepID=UPI0001C4C97A|nr:2-dehydro-3-deoxygalactonokinase [Azospirillum sp. B510]BAI75732.1 2-dehydro-3-deoxygalactonokinase [Azospirillum sp. B510]
MDSTVNPSAPALIALDWGTSSLRGFLLDGSARILAERATAHGIQALPQPGAAGFEAALSGLCGDWLDAHPSLPVVAGGMVGSAQGWVEAPYVATPADTNILARQAVEAETATGRRLLIAPGVLHDPAGGVPDVMRGEEIQIAGALAENTGWARNACIAMPGTHSKWVRIADGRIIGFSTFMTGELFAVLKSNSLLGRLMPAGVDATPEDEETAFAIGIRAAQTAGPGDLPHQMFATRTLGLTKRLPPEALAHYLSGLLIGHELRSGLAQLAAMPAGTPLLLIGDPTLCRRYGRGLAAFGITAAAQLGNTAPRGLFQFAAAAGLLPSVPATPSSPTSAP